MQCAGGINLVVAVANLLPLRIGPMRSDGGALLLLLRGGPGAARCATLSRWTDLLVGRFRF